MYTVDSKLTPDRNTNFCIKYRRQQTHSYIIY